MRKVEVLAGGKVIASLAGKRLAAAMSPFGGGSPARLAHGQAGFVMMDVSLHKGAKRAGGNSIVVDVGRGRYAHLQPPVRPLRLHGSLRPLARRVAPTHY